MGPMVVCSFRNATSPILGAQSKILCGKKKTTWKSMTTQKSSDLSEKKLEKDITFISLILAHTYLFFPHIHIYTRVSYDKVSI